MAYFDADRRLWFLQVGDLAYWVDGDTVTRCRVELITDIHIYVRVTAADHGHPVGQVMREARFSKRVAPREAIDFLVKASTLRTTSPVPWHRIVVQG